MDGATGSILSQTPVGSACDAIAGIPDIASDGSWEMVCGGRDGTVICISGGETATNSPSNTIPDPNDIAELIGTFTLVFIGCGSAVIAGKAIGDIDGLGLVGISLAFGLSLMAMVYAIGSISGCHINPAVSIAMLVCR